MRKIFYKSVQRDTYQLIYNLLSQPSGWFGLEIVLLCNDEKEVVLIEELTLDKQKITSLLQDISEGEVFPETLYDVIADWFYFQMLEAKEKIVRTTTGQACTTV